MIRSEKLRLPGRVRRLTLVAEKAPPAFLAVALPGLLAGAMQTAWVPNALVTVPALPAYSAPWERAGQSQADAGGTGFQHMVPTLEELLPEAPNCHLRSLKHTDGWVPPQKI